MTKWIAGFLGLGIAGAALTNAHAANLSGAYSIKFTTLCQSIENEVFGKSTQVQTIDAGKISQTVGTITFTPKTPGGSSGKVSAVFTQSQGSLAILGLPGPPASPAVPDMQISTGTQTGTYMLFPFVGAPATVYSLSITFAGKHGGSKVFTAYPSVAKSGVYSHADFIAIDGGTAAKPSCSNAGSIDHM
jgi:hypothetical protein